LANSSPPFNHVIYAACVTGDATIIRVPPITATILET
jgi:hypothetical protein